MAELLYAVSTEHALRGPYCQLLVAYGRGQVQGRTTVAFVQQSIQLHNAPVPPAIAQFGFGPGAGTLGGTDDYATFLRVYVPPGTALIDQSGWTQPWSQGPAYGGTMFSGYLILPHGTTRTMRLHYIVPSNVFLASHGPGLDPVQWTP